MALLSNEEAARMAGMLLQSSVMFGAVSGLIEHSPNAGENPDLTQFRKIQAVVERFRAESPAASSSDAFQQIAAIAERQAAVQIPGVTSSLPPRHPGTAAEYSDKLRTAAGIVTDTRAFVAEMMQAMAGLDSSEKTAKPVEWDLQVDGDQAVATTDETGLPEGTLGSTTLTLKRIGGKWRITSLLSDDAVLQFAAALKSSGKSE